MWRAFIARLPTGISLSLNLFCLPTMADDADIESSRSRVASSGEFEAVAPSPIRWKAGQGRGGLHGLRGFLGDVSPLEDPDTRDLVASLARTISAAVKYPESRNIHRLGTLLFLQIPQHAVDLQGSRAGPAVGQDERLLLGLIQCGHDALTQLEKEAEEKKEKRQQRQQQACGTFVKVLPRGHAADEAGGSGEQPAAGDRELREAQPQQEPADPVDACLCDLIEGKSDEFVKAKYDEQICEVR